MNENTELLKQILDGSNQMIQVSDLENYTMLYANGPACIFTGHEHTPYEGQHCYKYMMGLDSQCPFCPMLQMGDKLENTTEVDNGKQVFALKTAIMEWEGKKAFVEYTWDITAMRQAQKNFEAQVQTLLKSIPDAQGIFHVDLTEDKWLSSNGIAQNARNLQNQEDVNSLVRNILSFMPDFQKQGNIFAHFNREALIEAYYNGKSEVSEDFDCYYDDGLIRWSRFIARLILNPRNNHIECIYYGYDISEEKAKEEKSKQELFKALSDANKAKQKQEAHVKELQKQFDIISTVSKSFNSIYYVDMRDYSFIELGAYMDNVREVIGKKGDARHSFGMMLKYLVAPDQVEDMKTFVDLTTLNERLKNCEWITHQFYNPNNGKWSEGMFVAAARDGDGNCNHVIWSTRNIDEHKQKEIAYQEELKKAAIAAEIANKAKTNFLFNMSHDIRTPMNAIIGFRDLLEKYQEDPVKRADYLKKIADSSVVLLSLINNVLEMARIESGTMILEEKAWSVEQFSDTLFSVFNDMMIQKGLKFTREIIVENQYVYCDPIKMREVFLNILSNSYKYTNTGGSVHMKVEEVPCDKEGWATYKTTITDTGIGISEEYFPYIFDEFSRENNTTEAKVEGTGLGLPIVKRLVDFMDGKIEVNSTKGKGTSFIITISHKIAEKNNLTNSNNTELNPKSFEGKRILLAEDNDLNAEIAIEILSEVGLVIDRAEDGAICVEKLLDAEEDYYDLILMDIQMPNMNGYEATKTIRGLKDNSRAMIPIIAMTANAFEEDKRYAFEVGMNGHIAKPIDVRELMGTLSNMLR